MTKKGKEYTFESLGKLQYAMLADQENGAVGFRHMFPMSFLISIMLPVQLKLEVPIIPQYIF